MAFIAGFAWVYLSMVFLKVPGWPAMVAKPLDLDITSNCRLEPMKWPFANDTGLALGERRCPHVGIVVNLLFIGIFLPSGTFAAQVGKSIPAGQSSLPVTVDRSPEIAGIFPGYQVALAAWTLTYGNDPTAIHRPKGRSSRGDT